MRSVGLDLKHWAEKGLLFHEAWRTTEYGIEMHLLRIHKLVEAAQPRHVVIDPITTLVSGGAQHEVYSMLVRLMDYLKGRNITSVFTNLTEAGNPLEQTGIGISSLADTWILCRDQELNGERNRCIYVLKSRGMAHSNQLREFVLSREGIRLISPYVGPGVVLTGTSRAAQEAKEAAEALVRSQEIDRRQETLERKRSALEAQIKMLQMNFAAEELELEQTIKQQQSREKRLQAERDSMYRVRMGDSEPESDSALATGAGESN
jgi:circadian clock protein KaiC